ncbi:hypothetical protein BLNAU_16670 [Blattamonas nauphoetae]|uniref:Uncharacterized protein n=1 Tax=Blattamonas nauphoetae TaxID=2049346 RepID=A0ABQ9XDW1_9EUKA|nr:hypothetical protein BLNAU_16670 [Blattamonas nauphoetae]
MRQGQNKLAPFLRELMKKVWEERRKEGLVEDVPIPLFISTPLRNGMTPPEMVPLLDSASALLASAHPLSHSDAVAVTLFLTSLDNYISFKTKKGRNAFNSAFFKSLSSCPPFATSFATLMLLSLTCSHLELREERRSFWTDYVFSERANVQPVSNSGFFTVLAETFQTLRTGWSDDNIHSIHCFFTDIIKLIVERISPWKSTLETASDVEQFRYTQHITVNNVFVPLRPSLLHCARTNAGIAPHLDFLSWQDVNHPETVPFFEGMWEEVRQEQGVPFCGRHSKIEFKN